MNTQSVIEALAIKFTTLITSFTQQYPDMLLHLCNEPVGSLTPYQGYQIAIECLFPNVPLDEDDLVALVVDFCHLTTTPLVNADVTWGRGSIDTVFRDDWVVLTEQTVAQLFDDMPRLCQAFEQAMQRRRPRAAIQV